MLQNEEELRRMVYRIQRDGETDYEIAAKIEEYLVSIDRKIQIAGYFHSLVENVRFSASYKWDKNPQDLRTNAFYDGFFSNLVAAVNISCALVNLFFRFSKETRYAPNIGTVRKILKEKYPNHDLTDLFLKGYSDNPKTWMFSLRELRNVLHHESIYIGEFEVTDVSKREISFFLYEKYFDDSISRKEREIKYFCNNAFEKTEQFLSRMYRILLKELKTKNCVPLYSSADV